MRTDTRLSMALARMTEKKFLAALAVATVGLNLMLAGAVAAKRSHCAKDCKQDIKNCLGLVPPNKNCTGTKAEKKACRKNYATQRKACHGLVKLCKQQNPSMSGACLLSSTTTTSTTTPTTSPLPANTTTTTTTPTVTTCPILSEDFESGVLDPRISVQTVGTFNVPAGIQNVTDFGSSKAFGFGLSTCAVNCFLNFLTTLHINFDQPTLITTISFDEKEQFDNWGSEGRVFIDGTPLGTGEGGLGFDFGRVPVNDRHADTTFRSHVFDINKTATTIDLRVEDITNLSEIFIDNLVIDACASATTTTTTTAPPPTTTRAPTTTTSTTTTTVTLPPTTSTTTTGSTTTSTTGAPTCANGGIACGAHCGPAGAGVCFGTQAGCNATAALLCAASDPPKCLGATVVGPDCYPGGCPCSTDAECLERLPICADSTTNACTIKAHNLCHTVYGE